MTSSALTDAWFLATKALKIGRAFTKGRKSAPAEFRDVESQLYSLSAALNALAAVRESSHGSPLIIDKSKLPKQVPAEFANNQDIIVGMLESCKATLSFLEDIVDKYSVLGSTADPQQPRMKRWHRNLDVDWKKITWTREGGDIKKLRENLAVQTNSLNLIVGVVTSSQADRIQTDVTHVSSMLTEIHEWFVLNLKNSSNSPAATAAAAAAAAEVGGLGEVDIMEEGYASPVTELAFELHEQSGQSLKLICPRASLSQKASGAYYSTSLKTNQLFSCGCPRSGPDATNHRSTVEAYGLSPLSFATRIAGNERSWLLYKISNKITNQLSALVVKGVPPDVMHDFEELLVHGLSVIQTRQMLNRSMNTMLAHATDDDAACPKANLLDIVSNASAMQKTVTTVKFGSGGVHYFRDSIDFVQMLHYKSINLDSLMDDSVLPQNAFEESSRAEIQISYRKKDGKAHDDDIVRTVLSLRRNTESELKTDLDKVVVKNIECTGYDSNENQHPSMTATVTFEFVGRGAATQFYKEIEAMRMELFVIYLQHPRQDERVVLKLQAQNVHTERMNINDAEITILQNTETQRFRLIVQSRNGYSVLSQELAEDFFVTLSARGRPDYRVLSYEVYMDSSGKRCVRQCSNGFAHLVFSDSKIDQVFSMGLAAVAGPSQQQRLPEASQPMLEDEVAAQPMPDGDEQPSQPMEGIVEG